MEEMLILSSIAKFIGFLGLPFTIVALLSARNIRDIKRFLPITIGLIGMIASSSILKTMLISEQFEAMESQQMVQSKGNSSNDTSRLANNKPDQEITVEIYSDENEFKDHTKLIALVIGIVFTASVTLRKLRKKLWRVETSILSSLFSFSDPKLKLTADSFEVIQHIDAELERRGTQAEPMTPNLSAEECK